MRSLAGPWVAQRVWLMPMAAGGGLLAQVRGQVGDAAGPLADVQVRAGQRGHAGAVVAAIFQPAQAFEQDRLRFPMADVADDAAHERTPPLRGHGIKGGGPSRGAKGKKWPVGDGEG